MDSWINDSSCCSKVIEKKRLRGRNRILLFSKCLATFLAAILIPVSRAGTGIGGAVAAAGPPIPVPARLTGIKIATTESAA